MKSPINKVERAMLWVLPFVVFFAYYPVIRLGENRAMNFELSVPLIWLMLFGVLSLFRIPRIWKKLGPKKLLILGALPIFATVSLLWSANQVRGLLVAGVLDLLFLSGANILSLGWKAKEWRVFAKRHVIGGACISAFCILQCFLDVFGSDRSTTLLCQGCTYTTFGFPHPNGLAIEPQFMGNLLLAPAFLSLLFTYNTIKSRVGKGRYAAWVGLSFLIIMALYLCFSRGAIYAFILSLIYFMIRSAIRERRRFISFMIFGGISVAAFLGGLVLQGLLAEFSTTSEGFPQGVARAIHHLSLGKIDLREQAEEKSEVPKTQEEAVFNGYIEESTTVRLGLNEVAIEAWKQNPGRVFFGVGLGGAGVAINRQDGSYSAKEIIQNQYLSILLELGCFGLAATVLTLGGAAIFAKQKKAGAVFWALFLAYLISLCFFSGLPNVLHIYLLMPAWVSLGGRDKYGKIS